ncbi:MAG: glycine-rich domain-containing protein [Cyclobacteriaceae bacterium]
MIISSNVSLAQRFEIIPEVTLSTPGSNIYTVPTSTTLGPDEHVEEIILSIVMVGGGGGGRGQGAGGGGGGQVMTFTIDAFPGNTFSYTIGTGGAGSAIDGVAGSPGTPTSFDAQTANPGLGGEGGDAEVGGNSGSGNLGGGGASAGGNRRAGGGGGGASGNGPAGTVSTTGQPTAIGGIGGAGLLGYGGGGGGSAYSVRIQTSGLGVDGGTNGDAGTAANAINGGGGGGGSNRGGNGGNGLVIISATLIILPVVYAYINASFDDKSRTGNITWTTLKEWENSHFEIERTINNVKTFERIAKIEGVGYSDVRSDYSFTDEKLPLFGSMVYYRLKQVGLSGSFDYSNTVGMRISQVGITKGVWRAYPNPSIGEQLRIALLDRSLYNEEQITLRIIHPAQITQSITVNSENEMNDQLAVLIPRTPKGLIVIEIKWGRKVEHIKVLKK